MKRAIFALLLFVPIVAFLLVSFSSSSTPNKINKNDFSGRQLFSAIFFYNSDLSPTVLQNYKATESDELSSKEAAVNNLMNNINIKNKNYFEDFKTTITSGNQMEIKKILQSCLKEIDEVSRQISKNQLSSSINNEIEIDLNIDLIPPPPTSGVLLYEIRTQTEKAQNEFYLETLSFQLSQQFI